MSHLLICLFSFGILFDNPFDEYFFVQDYMIFFIRAICHLILSNDIFRKAFDLGTNFLHSAYG